MEGVFRRCAIGTQRLFCLGRIPQFIADETQLVPEYLYLYFTSPGTLKQVNSASVGSAAVSRNRFKEEAFLGFELTLPPLTTQRAILAKWQRVRTAIAVSEERIKKIESETGRQFFSDLDLKTPSREDAPKVFAVPWAEFLRWSVSYNQTTLTGMDLTRGRYPVVQLDSVLQLIQYGTSEKANTRGQGVPVIRMNNIVNGILDMSAMKHVELGEKECGRLVLKDGDILFNRTNSKGLVGKCAVFHDNGKCVFASYLIRVRVKPHEADPDFIVQALNSQIGRQQINALSRQIIGQANINNVELRSLQIPMPPVDVQHRIMEKVADGQVRIALEQSTARDLARQIEMDMEAYLLGTKKVEAT